MAKIKRIFPFGLLPGSWGLAGDTRLRAEIEYNWDGIDRERRLAKVGLTESYDMELVDLKFDLKEKKIDKYGFDIEKIELQYLYDKINEEERALKILDVRLEHERISKPEYDKERANYLKEPYVEVLSVDVRKEDPSLGAFELDWNDEFVKLLSEHGYTGRSDEEVVNDWFNTICRSVIAQNVADQDWGLEQVDISERPDVEIIRDEPRKETEDSNGTSKTGGKS